MSSHDPQSQKIAVNRPLVGVIALACLSTAAGLYVVHGDSEDWYMWRGAFTRAGLIMSAIWFALPSKGREAALANVSLPALFGFVAMVVAVSYRPRVYIPLMAVIAVVGFFLRPRGRRGSSPQSRPDRDTWQK